MGRYLIVILVALAVLLAACAEGGGGRRGRTTPTPTSLPASTPTPTVQRSGATATPTPTPRVVQPGEKSRGGKLVRLWDDPPTLDPQLTTDVTSAFVIVEVYGGLVTISPDLKLTPDLAESWDVSADGKVYTFHLRRNAKFHNGKQVTARDVKWSFERAADPATQSPVVDQYMGDIVGVKDKLAGRANEVGGVKVIDDYTLELTIDAPKSYFLAKLTYPTGFVLDQENLKDRNWTRRPNGTGPFKLAEYVLGEKMILERNDLYHLGPAYLDRVELLLAGGTSMLMYENGEIDIAGVGLADLDRVLDKNNPLNKDLKIAPTDFSIQYIGMNVTQPPFDDPKVRQALNYAINRKEIASSVLGDLVIPAKGILPPGFPAYNTNLAGYDYNPEKARQLLKESKYGSDMSRFPRITLTVVGGLGASVGLDLEVILDSWSRNLGINVDVQQTEFATFLKDLEKRRYQMFEIGWTADYVDPENFLDLLFYSGSNNNHAAYNNPEVDKLILQARVEQDQQKRNQLYQQIEQKILDDAPWIPLWHTGERHLLIKPHIHDYFLAPLIIPKLRFVYSTK